MKDLFKPHIAQMRRYQTSLGRDLDHGIRLDRNEKVSPFSDEVMHEIFSLFRGYSLSASPESEGLYKKIANYHGLKEEQVFVLSGITEGIRVFYDLATSPGDNIICLDPTYPLYWIYADMYDLEYRKFVCNPETLELDYSTLYDQMDSKTRFVLFPNPNLPIETCLSLDQLRDIAKRCRDNKTYFVIDEAYHYFGAPNAIPLIEEFDNVIIMRTFSKAFGLAGMRLGYMLSHPENIEYFSKSRSLVESNTFTMSIAEYMLDHPELMQAHVKEVKDGARYVQEELQKMDIRWFGGNYTNGLLIWMNSKEESDDIVAHMKAKKIYIRGAFEKPFDATIRISLGAPEYMKAFIDEFKNWRASHR